MSSSRRQIRGQFTVVVNLCLLSILGACSEPTVTQGPSSAMTASAPQATLTSAFDAFQFLGFVLDDQGANDTPAQSDLNAFTRADNVSGRVGVKWVWDDVNSWTGTGQTGDACALFDTDNDGKANDALCVRITNPNGDPNVVAQLDSPQSPVLYSCGDSKGDRCASPSKVIPLGGTHCEVEKIPGETFFANGDDGADVLAACSIPFSAISTTSSPNLLNVCSFPSGSPGSNAFDCVVTPGAGFLIIAKSTTPQSSGQTFTFHVSPRVVSDSVFTLTDNTANVEQTSLLSATPGTSYSVSETNIPSGWQLNAASCARQTSPNATPTGTKSGNAVNGIAITSGETTICTFANGVIAPTISVVKTASPDSIPETGGNVTYSVVVTNNAAIPVSLASLVDSVFGNLTGVGTCNGSGNAYGTIAAGGTYTCSFSKTLAASNAGLTHINKVTASVTSDGGPASASDTARVRYYDVKPSISVTKSADVSTITAAGGTSPDNFTPDETFSGAGGGGSSSLIFANDICDDAGPNDQPAQVDLNCFSRADNVSGRLGLRWTWDDINAWTGTGQTGDACALIDTDNNGFANYAFCDRISNPNGDPTVIAQVAGAPILYKCHDTASDRCASKALVQTLDASSVCAVSIVAEHFPGQGDDGADVQALCNLKLTDLGNVSIANIDFLNVCSFPSGSPNSNPFDCVVSPAAGFLVIAETTTPANSGATFGFVLGGATATNGFTKFAVVAAASSAGIPILPGNVSLNQLMPSNWSLNTVVCTRDGVTVASGTAATLSGISIVQGATTTCTFTNALVASATVTFTVTVTNNSLEAVNLYSLEDTENPSAVTPTYSTLNGVGTCATGGSIAGSSGTYSCTFTRTISGSPGFSHSDKIRAVGKDDELNADTKLSNVVTVTIN